MQAHLRTQVDGPRTPQYQITHAMHTPPHAHTSQQSTAALLWMWATRQCCQRLRLRPFHTLQHPLPSARTPRSPAIAPGLGRRLNCLSGRGSTTTARSCHRPHEMQGGTTQTLHPGPSRNNHPRTEPHLLGTMNQPFRHHKGRSGRDTHEACAAAPRVCWGVTATGYSCGHDSARQPSWPQLYQNQRC